MFLRNMDLPDPAGFYHVSLVAEEYMSSRSVPLLSSGDSTIQYYIDSNEIGIRIRQALRGILERKEEIRLTQRERQDFEKKRNEIHREQARIRENLERLEKESNLYRRYTAIMGEQEDQLEEITTGIDRLTKREREQNEALKAYVLSLQTD